MVARWHPPQVAACRVRHRYNMEAATAAAVVVVAAAV